jgi:hypothetical protein
MYQVVLHMTVIMPDMFSCVCLYDISHSSFFVASVCVFWILYIYNVHYAASRKVAGSGPNEVEFLNLT